jgi:nucleotide-binding universal stress UspA family protein
MFQQIMVPLDASPRAELALSLAAQIARASGGSILLLQVVSPLIDFSGGLSPAPLMTEQVIESDLAEGNTYLNKVAKSGVFAGITTTTEVLFGLPAQDILAVAESRSVDLIVMCSHGRTGLSRWVLGSVAHRIVHQSFIPVLVLRANKPMLHIPRTDATRPLCALVPLDGSPLAEAALIPAANLVTALAAPAPGALHLIQVVKHLSPTGDEGFTALLNKEAMEHAKTYLASVKERTKETLKDLKLSITWSITNDSDVADAIIGTAEHAQQQEETEGASGCDLIAMSTHGQGGWERLVMGSVTERVLSATRLPLRVVRPRQTGTTKS